MRLTAADLAAVPLGLLEPVSDDGMRYLARDLVAGEVDRWLRVLSHQEARCRVVFGRLAAVLLRQQGAQRLGFCRVGDYARECLGLSARELQTAARVVTALAGLPRLAAAFEAGVLSWTQLRILVTVATPATEIHCLDLARGRTVRALEALVRKGRAGSGAEAAATDASGLGQESPATGRMQRSTHREPGDGEAGSGDSVAGEMLGAVDDALRFHLRCPRRVRRLWRRAIELARRMLGSDGPLWQAAEAIAAEGLAAAPVAEVAWGSVNGVVGGVGASPGTGSEAIHGGRRDGEEDGASERPPAWECLDWSAVRAAIPREVARLADGCDRLDAFALDTRLREVLQAQRRIDWQLGRLLHTCVRLRLERLLGFSSIAAYARDRLGLSPSKVRGLVAVERAGQGARQFGAAYEAGELSWVRALVLLPVLVEGTAAAWTARAQAITVRRLVAEVDWSLDQWDAQPALGRSSR